MRVISGKVRGHKLQSVPGDTTRPILDRIKTSVFDILRPELEGALFLDLFAGSGAVGIEALSQGAERVVFLDLAPKAVETIQKNLEHCKLLDQAEVRRIDAFQYLKKTRSEFDLIYIAPPQYKGLWEEAMRSIAERPSLVRDNGLLVVQIDPKEYVELDLSDFKLSREKTHGNTQILFYRKQTTST